MGEPIFIDLRRVPFVYGRLHATNNPSQRTGPKGFIEVKVLKNDNLYVRVDLPGVPDDAVRHRVDSVRQKVVFFSGETLDDGYREDCVREYSGTAGLGCDCCEITGVDAKMKDGVLRMIVSRVKVKDHEKCTLTFPPFTGFDPNPLPKKITTITIFTYLFHNQYRKCSVFAGCATSKSGTYEEVENHQFVVKGPKEVLSFGVDTADGGTYYSVDVPGVCSDDITVFPVETEVRFYAENKNVYEHDESGRIYMGAFKSPTPPHAPSYLTHDITWDAEYGVLKVLITPPKETNSE